MRTGHVRELTAECNLTALCLQYLTFDCFKIDISQKQLRQFALDGYFAFQDYAIAHWFHHLHAIVKAGQDFSSGSSDLQGAIQEIGVALDSFVSNYKDEILHTPVASASEKSCEALKSCTFHENLLLLWSHIYRHQEKGFDARNDVSIKVLSDALTRNRQLIEDLTSSNLHSYSGALNSFYGEKRYKCPKVTCYYFHEGSKDARSRDMHINSHNRPFKCTFPDCPAAKLGFPSNKGLEKHIKSSHPKMNDREDI
jgi:hypothetical protein